VVAANLQQGSKIFKVELVLKVIRRSYAYCTQSPLRGEAKARPFGWEYGIVDRYTREGLAYRKLGRKPLAKSLSAGAHIVAAEAGNPVAAEEVVGPAESTPYVERSTRLAEVETYALPRVEDVKAQSGRLVEQ